jgi:hypothetical protein
MFRKWYRYVSVCAFFMLHFIQFLSGITLYTCPKGLILVVGTMPPKKPSTRQSSRAPKLKESEVREGSSPGPTKQLEFSPKPKPVINTSTKKICTQPPAFGDTKASIGTKELLPHWEEIFKKIKREEFLE